VLLAVHAPAAARPSPAEGAALLELVESAREFGRKTPRRHPSGAYGRALARLVAAAHHASAMDEVGWAAEVAELRDQLEGRPALDVPAAAGTASGG